jgi:hypothetical protein
VAGLTPEVGGRSSRPNHALTGVVSDGFETRLVDRSVHEDAGDCQADSGQNQEAGEHVAAVAGVAVAGDAVDCDRLQFEVRHRGPAEPADDFNRLAGEIAGAEEAEEPFPDPQIRPGTPLPMIVPRSRAGTGRTFETFTLCKRPVTESGAKWSPR